MSSFNVQQNYEHMPEMYTYIYLDYVEQSHSSTRGCIQPGCGALIDTSNPDAMRIHLEREHSEDPSWRSIEMFCQVPGCSKGHIGFLDLVFLYNHVCEAHHPDWRGCLVCPVCTAVVGGGKWGLAQHVAKSHPNVSVFEAATQLEACDLGNGGDRDNVRGILLPAIYQHSCKDARPHYLT